MIYIVGAGYMAREYVRVLKELDEKFLVVGRGAQSVEELKLEFDVYAVSGGISNFIKNKGLVPDSAIVCTSVELLAPITLELLDFGVKNILLEKPGAITIKDLIKINEKMKEKKAKVIIGYNRRFYQATIALENKLKDEELIAVNFEITEWSHLIADDSSAEVVKQKWMLANTSHVIDLVMHITGRFKVLSTFSSGSLPWHDTASRFVGSGISENGVLVSYFGYWDGPGRWSAEFVTTKNRYILRPMEKLQIQKLGSVVVEFDEVVDYSLDENFKPGLFLQVKAFLEGDLDKFVTINEQVASFETYSKIANYRFE